MELYDKIINKSISLDKNDNNFIDVYLIKHFN